MVRGAAAIANDTKVKMQASRACNDVENAMIVVVFRFDKQTGRSSNAGDASN